MFFWYTNFYSYCVYFIVMFMFKYFICIVFYFILSLTLTQISKKMLNTSNFKVLERKPKLSNILSQMSDNDI